MNLRCIFPDLEVWVECHFNWPWYLESVEFDDGQQIISRRGIQKKEKKKKHQRPDGG